MLMPPSSHQAKESMQALSSKPTFALFRPHSLLRGAHDSYTICRDRGVTGSNPARPTTTNTQEQRFKICCPYHQTHTQVNKSLVCVHLAESHCQTRRLYVEYSRSKNELSTAEIRIMIVLIMAPAVEFEPRRLGRSMELEETLTEIETRSPPR